MLWRLLQSFGISDLKKALFSLCLSNLGKRKIIWKSCRALPTRFEKFLFSKEYLIQKTFSLLHDFPLRCISLWNWTEKLSLFTCSYPSSLSSTTTKVSFFFLKSNLVILGQQKSPILVSPSKTRIPVGVSPKEYSEPSLPKTVCMSTPYISKFFTLLRNCISDWAGVSPL